MATAKTAKTSTAPAAADKGAAEEPPARTVDLGTRARPIRGTGGTSSKGYRSAGEPVILARVTVDVSDLEELGPELAPTLEKIADGRADADLYLKLDPSAALELGVRLVQSAMFEVPGGDA